MEIIPNSVAILGRSYAEDGITQFGWLYSVQLRNDRAAIFTKACAVVRLYYTQLQIRFPLKMRTDDRV